MIARTLCILFIGSAFSSLADAQQAKRSRMNVVLILIDDLGWSDLGCYGSQYYQTPHIDALASRSVRFTDGYAACNVCSPTRGALLTGKYPARMLLTQWLPAGRWDAKKYKMREGRFVSNLSLEEVTIAEALREEGYRTGFFGKWHLGTETYYYPEHQGFDVNVGGRDYGAPGSYHFPFKGKWKIPTTGKTLFKDTPVPGKPGDYLVDNLAEQACEFIRDSAEEPFFAMVSHYAVHSPLQGKPEKVARYERVPAEQRQGNPKYAAMVESVDESVGRIVKTLEDLEIDDRTLVVFTSDNGGFAKATSNAPLRANKGSSYEGGIRVPVLVHWPGSPRNGTVCKEPVSSMDFYPTILRATGSELRPYQHVDGVDLSDLIAGRVDSLNRDSLFWHYPHYNQHPESFPCSVIRRGNWKLIQHHESSQVQLFDLEADLGEQNDLAAQRPAIVTDLTGRLNRWRREVGADPMLPNPQYQGN